MVQIKKFKISVAVPILMLLVLILGGLSSYFIFKYKRLQKSLQPESITELTASNT